MFVTLSHGIYNPTAGEIVLASAGHPMPLLRTVKGEVQEITHPTGRLLGYKGEELHLHDKRFALAPGDSLVFYTDGITEARDPERKSMFGLAGLKELAKEFDTDLSLAVCAQRARDAVEAYTQSRELQDDWTLFLLRRILVPPTKRDVTLKEPPTPRPERQGH
jgi:sigma-B regulation protein RsbU (phosphoserine phosphatase)